MFECEYHLFACCVSCYCDKGELLLMSNDHITQLSNLWLLSSLHPTTPRNLTNDGHLIVDSAWILMVWYRHLVWVYLAPYAPVVVQAPRGLSAEEKRVRLLAIFHESVGVSALESRGYCLTIRPEGRKISSRSVEVYLHTTANHFDLGFGNSLYNESLVLSSRNLRSLVRSWKE